jgi:prophage antirepressor-like protein
MIENSVATTRTSIIKPTIFENEKFGSVRTMTIDNEPWFVGKDVAECLDYKNPRQAIITNVDEDDKGVHSIDTLGGIQKMTIINESGLYSLILLSHLKKAKEFKHWVTSEVLPSIRKTGGYGVTNNNAELAELLAEIISLRREVAEIKSLVIPTQSNYYLWKNSIATPLVKTISNILGLPIADTYKVIYDDMVLRGFNQSYAMNRFCNKYKVDSVSTIDAVADVDEYIRMFMDSANKFLEMNTATSDTPPITSQKVINNIDTSSNAIIDYSTLTVEEIIKPLVDLYHDTSVNNAYTYKRVYKVMRSDRSWKALMTRRHCKSKKNLVTKFDDIRRDFAKAVNHLMETGNVEAGGVV